MFFHMLQIRFFLNLFRRYEYLEIKKKGFYSEEKKNRKSSKLQVRRPQNVYGPQNVNQHNFIFFHCW